MIQCRYKYINKHSMTFSAAVRGTQSSRKYIYCSSNVLSAHSDPTNIGAASDQRSSSSAATAGARRSFRSVYLSEQSKIGVTSGLVLSVVHSANLAHYGDSSSFHHLVDLVSTTCHSTFLEAVHLRVRGTWRRYVHVLDRSQIASSCAIYMGQFR